MELRGRGRGGVTGARRSLRLRRQRLRMRGLVPCGRAEDGEHLDAVERHRCLDPLHVLRVCGGNGAGEELTVLACDVETMVWTWRFEESYQEFRAQRHQRSLRRRADVVVARTAHCGWLNDLERPGNDPLSLVRAELVEGAAPWTRKRRRPIRQAWCGLERDHESGRLRIAASRRPRGRGR
jgi:hypothetical protein